jgi:predicted metal-dependent peptidase
MTATETITKARTALLRDQPFFGALALRLVLKEDPSCPTAWTDGRTIGFSPAFVARLTLAEIVGVLAHEVLHAALGHITRRGNRDSKVWNQAADYTINGTLTESGFALPSGALNCRSFQGLSPEEVYPKLASDDPQGSATGTGTGAGEGDSQGGTSDPGGCGEVRDAPAKNGSEGSESDKRESETEWKVAVSQAANIAKGMGAMSASLERIVGKALAPVLDWKAVLHRFVQEQVQRTETWNPPDRRFIWQGIYSPGLGGTEAGHIVVGVDTSGSINGSILDQFASEIRAIRDETGAELTVIYCDAAVQRVDHFGKDEAVEIKSAGGGGTDFAPVFARVEEDGLRPACLIYLTDLQGSFPRVEPPYPVLWAVLGSEDRPPFGEILRIE